MKKTCLLILMLFLIPTVVFADELSVTMNAIDANGIGEVVGTIKVSSILYGALFKPNLNGLIPGLHGFHIHENPTCMPGEKGGKSIPGLAAGGHYDPTSSGIHRGPYGKGHLGDLPALYVDTDGRANHPVLAPRIKLAYLKGRSIMIHIKGDNYSDTPNKLGGGGGRMVCGVFR